MENSFSFLDDKLSFMSRQEEKETK